VLASTSRSAVLQALRDASGPLGVVEVSDAVGLHQNTTRGHLDVLVEAGYVVRRTEKAHGPGRPRIVYEATDAPEDGSNYKLIAEVLAEYVAATAAQPVQAAAEAGRAWVASSTEEAPGPADRETVLAGLVRLLADGGFQPEVADGGDEIHLHHCPFVELAAAHPDVVCGAHLGIIEASLERLGAPAAGTRLLPFVQPNLCVTRLADPGGLDTSALDAGPRV
jgi:predicted ArsR family transcriptional regulator